ncbi:MAG: sensor histidine kinase, partial [Thermodesulfobacteriota bacterium]
YIIRLLLDFSHRTHLRRSAIDPASLATSAVSAVGEEAQAKGTSIRVTGSKDDAPVELDTIRVQQALINLLRNAIQCSPTGNIRCSWKLEGQGVLFCVDDDGPGVPKKIRSKIFEPFYTTKAVGEGTGLGLAVAHSVAEEHGGTLEVGESDMGGASFRLMIPAGPMSDAGVSDGPKR